MEQKGYDVAQVCMNGHVTNDSTQHMPDHNQEYCDKCGKKTITSCTNCQTNIKGWYWGGGISTKEFHPPSYCHKCGNPFPWTETRIKTVIEYSQEFGGLNNIEASELGNAITDIISETPRTQLGASKFKTIMSKVGTESANAIREIIVDIVSETAKKIIWGK